MRGLPWSKMMRQRHEQEQQGTPVGFLTFVVQHRCADGRLFWGEVLSKPDRNAKGDSVGYHGITREITERKLLEDQVHQLAFYDPLTHVANRRLLNDRLDQALTASRRSGLYGALLFLDLDNFKTLNDQHGHGVGDLLLVEVANRLKSCVWAMDTVAHGSVAPQVVEHRCSASIGVVVFNGSGASHSVDLLKHAATAMYQAKAAGRNRVWFYVSPAPPAG